VEDPKFGVVFFIVQLLHSVAEEQLKHGFTQALQVDPSP